MPARRIGYGLRRMRSGRWQVLVRAEDGTQVGMGTHSSKADAEKAGLELAAQVRSRTWQDPRKSDIPLAAWMRQWLQRKQATGRHGARYAEDAARMIRLYVDPTPLARIVLTDLRPAHVARWYDDMVSARRRENCSVGLVPASGLSARALQAHRGRIVALRQGVGSAPDQRCAQWGNQGARGS